MIFSKTLASYLNQRSWWVILKPVYIVTTVAVSLLLAYAHSYYLQGTIEIDDFTGIITPVENVEVDIDEQSSLSEFSTEESLSGDIEAQPQREGFWSGLLVYLLLFTAGYFVFRWTAFKLYLRTQYLKISDKRRRFTSLDIEERYYQKLDLIKESLEVGTEDWRVLDFGFVEIARDELEGLNKIHKRLETAGTASHTFYEIHALLHYYEDQFDKALDAIDDAVQLKGADYSGARILRKHIKDAKEEMEVEELEGSFNEDDGVDEGKLKSKRHSKRSQNEE